MTNRTKRGDIEINMEGIGEEEPVVEINTGRADGRPMSNMQRRTEMQLGAGVGPGPWTSTPQAREIREEPNTQNVRQNITWAHRPRLRLNERQTYVSAQEQRQGISIHEQRNDIMQETDFNWKEWQTTNNEQGQTSLLPSQQEGIPVFEQAEQLQGEMNRIRTLPPQQEQPLPRNMQMNKNPVENTSIQHMGFGCGKSLVPPPLKYSLESGQNFEDFLLDFEVYCTYRYPAVKETWSRVLVEYLEGEILTAFKNLDGGRMAYSLVKTKLRTMVKQAATSKDILMSRFWEAQREEKESILSYSMRLDKLAGLAGIDKAHDLYDDMKKQKIMDGLSKTSAARVKFASLMEPQLTVGKVLELANNVEECFEKELLNNQKDKSKAIRKEKSVEIQETIIMENKRPKEIPQCNYCQRKGHLESQCYRKNPKKREDLVCTHCQRTGHEEVNCYTKNGKCYGCGQVGHQIKDCRKKQNRRNTEQREENVKKESNVEKENNIKKECPYCGGNHLMNDCSDFKLLMLKKSGNE